MTHAAEQELSKLAKLKPFKRGDRQAFLQDLLAGCDKTLDNMSKSDANEAYEALSLEAKEWYQGCIDRQDANPKAELPEFEEVSDEAEDDDNHERDANGGDADDIPFDADSDDDDGPAKPVAKKQPPVKRKPITLSPAKPEKVKAKAKEVKGAVKFRPPVPGKPVAARPAAKPVAPVAKKANGPVKGERGNGIIQVIIAAIWKHPKDTVQELRERLEKKNIQTSEVTIAQERRTFKRQVAFLVQEGVMEKNPFAEKR